MDGSVETSRPTLGPKPRLAPKPFSLQKNSTIRSIHAPRAATATSRSTNSPSGKAEAAGVPKVPLPIAAQTPPDSTPSSLSAHIKDEPKTTGENPQRADPVPQTTRVPKVSSPATGQKPPQQTTATNEHSPASEHVKDEPKTDKTEENKNREVTPDSTVAASKTDPVLQTIGALKETPSTAAQKAPQQTTANEHITDEPKPTRPSPHREDTATVAPARLALAPQTTPPKEASDSIAVQKEDVVETNHEAQTAGSKSEQKDSKNEEEKTSVIQKPEESSSVSPSAANPEYHWRGSRRRLSAKLTSKFESGGPPVCPQPTVTVSTTSGKADAKKPVSSSPEQSQTTTEPSNRESNDGVLIDYSGGESIQRRISQLFDSSVRPEAATKKEEPDIQTSSGGVKERIRNWVVDTSSEVPKPQVVSRTRSKSVDSPASPVGDKTPKTTDVQRPAADAPSTQAVAPSTQAVAPSTQAVAPSTQAVAPSTQAVAPSTQAVAPSTQAVAPSTQAVAPSTQAVAPSTQAVAPSTKDSPVKQPIEAPVETSKEEAAEKPLERTTDMPGEQGHNKSVEPEVVLRPKVATDQAATNEGQTGSSESPQRPLKKSNAKRRSVRFGIVESDDGGPPLILGSPSDSEEEDKSKEHTSASVPVFKRVGSFLKKNEEIQKKEEEHEKQVELEKTLNAEENERARLELEEERKRAEEREKENARQREEEKRREEEREKQRLKEEEVQRQKEEERERERLKEEEQKRQMEMLQQRQIEEERERIKQKEQEEREKERLRKEKAKELEQMKQKEEERARQMEERLRLEEMERERLRKEAEERERENKRRLEEEEKMKARQEEEEERKRRIELEIRIQQEQEEAKERMRQIEKQKEDERKKQLEKERVEELERKMQEELERKRLRELEEKLRMEEAKKTEKESDLISFDSEDVPQKSEAPLSQAPKPFEPSANEVEIIYDDFSVKTPQMDVDFEDFSVKPRRWGSQAKVETAPVRSWRADPVLENVAVLVDVHPQESKAPEKVVKPDSPEPAPATESPEEEEEEEEEPVEQQLIYVDPEEATEEEEKESTDGENTTEDESEDEEAQVNSYCVNPEDEDSDALIDTSPDQQNGVCEQTTSPESGPDHVPEVSPEDVDPDSATEPDFPFPESSTPLLDTSVQKSKVDLCRRRSRSRPSRSLRLAQTESQTWRVHDSTDEQNGSTKQEDSEPAEKQPKLHKASSSSPALNPAAQIIAQLKRRTAGGGASKGEAKEEVKQREEDKSPHKEVTPAPSPLPRSPRNAAQLAGAARVLPPLVSSDGGAVSSPAWLKELKSKKRLSQYDSET